MSGSLVKESLFHVVLISPRIPWNTGNIGRTCMGFGAKLHIVNPLFEVSDKGAKRAGLDYWNHLEVRTYPHLSIDEFITEQLPLIGKPVYFTKFASKPIHDVDFFPAMADASAAATVPTSTTLHIQPEDWGDGGDGHTNSDGTGGGNGNGNGNGNSYDNSNDGSSSNLYVNHFSDGSKSGVGYDAKKGTVSSETNGTKSSNNEHNNSDNSNYSNNSNNSNDSNNHSSSISNSVDEGRNDHSTDPNINVHTDFTSSSSPTPSSPPLSPTSSLSSSSSSASLLSADLLLDSRRAFVFGSEVEGLSDVKEADLSAGECVHVPMLHDVGAQGIRSYNVSSTVGMALMEAQRQLYECHRIIDPRFNLEFDVDHLDGSPTGDQVNNGELNGDCEGIDVDSVYAKVQKRGDYSRSAPSRKAVAHAQTLREQKQKKEEKRKTSEQHKQGISEGSGHATNNAITGTDEENSQMFLSKKFSKLHE